MNIEWINTNGLNQEANIYEMCLLKKENDNYIPITVACMCKDYFQDSFFMARMKNNLNPSLKDKIQCYGYTVKKDDPDLNELNKDTLYIALKHKNEDSIFDELQALNSQMFINYYDNLFNRPLSKVYLSDDLKSIVFEYSIDWTNTLYMLSLYTLLIRCSLYCNTTDVNDEYINTYENNIVSDFKNKSMFISVRTIINKLFDKSFIIACRYDYESLNNATPFDMMNLHHYSGILSLNFDAKPKRKYTKKVTSTI